MTDTTKDIIQKNTVAIHGKDYLTVPGRVQLWHEDQQEKMALETKVRIEAGFVIAEAVVYTKKGTFTGTSAVNLASARNIEKDNPVEVAETSAVGRALGFANYGMIDSIASADEMTRSTAKPTNNVTTGYTNTGEILAKAAQKRQVVDTSGTCPHCGSPAEYRTGTTKAGKPWRGYFCTDNKDHPVTWLRPNDPDPIPAVEQESEPTADEINATVPEF